MARPFPNTFDADSPMSPQSASSNISYSTNVNRQKTKKWAEAKPVDYGGGWGDDDDEYDPPPPPSKPTGVRQQGQARQSLEPSAVDNKKYGDLPPLPAASNPRGRANSFDEDDEKRDFSSSAARQPSPPTSAPAAGPATRFSQITGLPTVRNPSEPPALSVNTTQPPPQAPAGLRKAVNPQVVSPVSGSPHPDILQPGRVNTGESNPLSPQSDTRTASTTSDYQAGRDFSPSAVPRPLATRASPGPQSATDSPATRYPARQSSLSQITNADDTETTPKSWTQNRSPSPGASAHSSVSPTTGKALPFIRPADIYRRMEEEKREKERQSMESGRPSMDSVVGAKSSVRSESPKTQLGERSSSDILPAGGQRTTSPGTEDFVRRPISNLQSVPERKSEYGLEGFRAIAPTQQAPGADLEKARSMSTSPKLPDLNRISGFGMDMFTQASTTKPVATVSNIDTTPTASSSASLGSPNAEDLTLRTQPSFGFKSVVNQAFDRNDDSSLPNTPASRNGSQVKRSDSESTGTAGISPIMSRVPSTANPATRNTEFTTPSIPEALNEPDSPEAASKTISEAQQDLPPPGFKPGHRRDISTPSPGNSPARTPDLGTPTIITNAQQIIVSEPSPTAEPETQPARPAVGRDQSFRPSLPGSWISYAGTDESEASVEPIQTQRGATPSPQPIEGDRDITPTTSKHPLLKTALEATAVGAAAVGVSAATPGRNESATRSDGPMPTPDYNMAPSGSIYSTKTVDPRLQNLPPLENAPEESQLRSDVIHRPISTPSSGAPTPPPKDTSRIGAETTEAEYFPQSNLPLIQKASESPQENGHNVYPSAGVLPTLNTETDQYEQENDKLSQDIVRSLSPRGSDTHRDTLLPETNEGESSGLNRESTYLPSEYDNYWASTEEENDHSSAPAQDAEQPLHVINIPLASTASIPVMPTPVGPDPSLSPRPLTPRKADDGAFRPHLQNRFSWEKSSDDFADTQPEAVQGVGAPSNSGHAAQEPQPPTFLPEPSTLPPSTSLPQPSALPEAVATQPPSYAPVQTEADHSDKEVHTQEPYPATNEGHHFGRDAAIVTGVAAAAGGIAAATHHHHQPEASRRLSLAEEKDPTVSSYPVSPTPPEHEHPARSSQPYFSPKNQPSVPAPPSTVSPITSPVLPQAVPSTIQPKLIPFKTIAAMGSPQDRIHSFNDVRQKYAAIDSGLNNWMATLQTQFPEHSDASGSWGASQPGLSMGSAKSRHKVPGAAPPPLQQPYYQQYLNASSPTTPGAATSRPGPSFGPSQNMQPNSSQGFSASPGANKLTTHQVQAKGKEFLHGASIFGGKAGKAGKGLLAKGKNKLKGAGGGDKDSDSTSTELPPHPSKTKNDRRSSWGLPFAKHPKTDSSPRSTREHLPLSSRGRSSTVSSEIHIPTPPRFGNISGRHSIDVKGVPEFRGIGGSGMQQFPPQPPLAQPTLRQVASPEPSTNTVPVFHENESRDLAPPAPLSKLQPTWDPVNAAPIAEEEVTIFPPAQPHVQGKTSLQLAPRGSLSVPADARSKSERSNSENAKFYDAREDPTTPEVERDWVMVDPSPEGGVPTVGAGPSVEPVVTSKGVSELEPDEPKNEEEPKHSLDAPVTSILDRPRGSSYGVPSPPLNSPIRAVTAVAAKPTLISSPAPVQALHQGPPQEHLTAQYQQPPQQTQTSYPTQQSSSLATHPPQPQQDPEKSSFLPPIRRTSTFGLGFGSRTKRERFPIDDDEDEVPGGVATENTPGPGNVQRGVENGEIYAPPPGPPPQHLQQQQQQQFPTGVSRGPPQQVQQQFQQPPPQQPPASYQPAPPQGPPPGQAQRASGGPQPGQPPFGQVGRSGPVQGAPPAPFIAPPLAQKRQSFNFFKTRPPLEQSSSSEQNQQRAPHHSHPPPVFIPQGGQAALQHPEFTQSHVEWKPNRPKPQHSATSTSQASQSSPSYWKEQDISPPRTSWDQSRRASGVPVQRFEERPPFVQPPSSAQRYPELFKQDQPQSDPDAEFNNETGELPPHMYAAPIPRTQAFLPRQQGNEYQLPGVGPPTDEPRPASRRNSGMWKEIGGKLSRASSRDRRNSISREGREPEDADSTVTSEDGQERNKHRASFFGGLYRASTGGGPPHSRESTIAHHAGSRTDLMEAEHGQPSPLSQHERKRSFFGGPSHVEQKKPTNLTRASTGGLSSPSPDDQSKKKRTSILSGLFKTHHRDAPPQHPQAVRELSYGERQPLDSPGMQGLNNFERRESGVMVYDQNGPRQFVESAHPSKDDRDQNSPNLGRPAGREFIGPGGAQHQMHLHQQQLQSQQGPPGGPARLSQQMQKIQQGSMGPPPAGPIRQMQSMAPPTQQQTPPPASMGSLPGGPNRQTEQQAQLRNMSPLGGPMSQGQQQYPPQASLGPLLGGQVRQAQNSVPPTQQQSPPPASVGPPGGPARLQNITQAPPTNQQPSLSIAEADPRARSASGSSPQPPPMGLPQSQSSPPREPNLNPKVPKLGPAPGVSLRRPETHYPALRDTPHAGGISEVYEPPEGPPPSHLLRQQNNESPVGRQRAESREFRPPEGPPLSHVLRQANTSSPAASQGRPPAPAANVGSYESAPATQVPTQAQNANLAVNQGQQQAQAPKFNDKTPPKGINMGPAPPSVRQVSNPAPAGYSGTPPPQGASYSGTTTPQSLYAPGTMATPLSARGAAGLDAQRQVQNPSPLSQRSQQPDPRVPQNSAQPINALPLHLVRRESDNLALHQQYMGTPSAIQQQRNVPSPARGLQPDPRLQGAQTMRMAQPDGRLNSMNSNPNKQRPSSMSRSVLSKLGGGSTPDKLSKEKKERSSFMGGLLKRKDKDDRSSEDSRSQGSAPRSKVNQNQGVPGQFVPRAQTYTDLAQREPYVPPQQQQQRPQQQAQYVVEQPYPSAQPQQPGLPGQPPQERGRRVSREPQYDQVPIPGGYSLVRGQGAIPVPTEYDPRGLSRLHQQQQADPRYQKGLQQQNPALLHPRQHGYPAQQATNDAHALRQQQAAQIPSQVSRSNPNLSAPETYNRDLAPRRLSREDMLARSPPKSPEGQQRPYQLTLPDTSTTPPHQTQQQMPAKLNTIQRLQKPVLRHPESPAGYPLPEDDVFSPVNEAARDYPPPPPPKWPGDGQPNKLIGHHDRAQSISTVEEGGLDRSNTHRTAVSAISRLSGPADSPRHSSGGGSGSGGLNVPHALVEGQRTSSSPSPTPPSPLPGTPGREVSPEREEEAASTPVRITVLEHPSKNEDLYDASPRLPKPVSENGTPSPIKNLGESSVPLERHNALGTASREVKGRYSVEEKIPYQQPQSIEGLAELDDQEPGTAMSATSYPGQEWNPYGSGWIDDE